MRSGNQKKKFTGKTAITLAVLALSIVLGVLSYVGLASLYTPPQEEPEEELRLAVEVIEAKPENVTVMLSGYGEARAASVTPISARVAGEVIAVHPNLEVGRSIGKGEVLVRIDPVDYELAKAQAEEQIKQAQAALARLRGQYEADQARLKTVLRSYELTEKEFQRHEDLLKTHDIGTQSRVGISELTLNQARDAYDQLKEAVKLLPITIQGAESALDVAQLQLKHAELELSRTTLCAPFAGRVKRVQVEIGQMAVPGVPVVILADDSFLEFSVPLDSDAARSWLHFANPDAANGQAWFGKVEAVACTISWTEGRTHQHWEGVLDRIERFDPMTRTVTVAVRVAGEQATLHDGPPLVEGMFCHVEIPGETLEAVYRLPRHAVTYDGDIYVAVRKNEGASYALQRRPVDVVRCQDDSALVREGLEPGTYVIITKLTHPLPYTPLDIQVVADPFAASDTPTLPAERTGL